MEHWRQKWICISTAGHMKLHFADDNIIKTAEENTPLRNAQPTPHTPRDTLHIKYCCSLIANTNLLSAQTIDSINIEQLSSFSHV